jgi:hypothetical protein
MNTSAASESRSIQVTAVRGDERSQLPVRHIMKTGSIMLRALASVVGKRVIKVPKVTLRFLAALIVSPYTTAASVVAPGFHDPGVGIIFGGVSGLVVGAMGVVLSLKFGSIPMFVVGLFPVALFIAGLLSQKFKELFGEFKEEVEKLSK